MIKIDDTMENTALNEAASTFKLGGGLDINKIPGKYANEDYELAKNILVYRDAINNLIVSADTATIEAGVKKATSAMFDVTTSIEKLKAAKRLDGVKTLDPHEIAYLNIVGGLNQLFKNYIERIEGHGESGTECDCCNHT